MKARDIKLYIKRDTTNIDPELAEIRHKVIYDETFEKSLNYESLGNGYIKVSKKDASGFHRTTILAEIEFEEAADHFARLGRDEVGYSEMISYFIKKYGVAFFLSLFDVKLKTSILVSKGYIAFLAQQMLGCKVNRIDAISAETIGSIFGLGSDGSDCRRQVRRFRQKATEQILEYIKIREAESGGNSNYVIKHLVNFIRLNMKKALNFIIEKKALIKRYAPAIQGMKLIKALKGNPAALVNSAVEKICGHFYPAFVSA